MFKCSTWYYITATRATKKNHDRGDGASFSILIEDIIHGKSWQIELFPKRPVGRIAKTSSIDRNFMQSFCPSRRSSTCIGKNLMECCLSQIWTPRHSFKGSDCHHIARVLVEYWQNLSKLTNQRVYQIVVYPERPFVKFAHRRSFASSHRAFSVFFFFFRAAFLRAAPQPTERPEEANGIKNIRIRCRIRRICV